MKQKVMFATPTYDYHVCGEYLAAMMMTSIHLTHLKVEVTAQLVAGLCFIDLARNKLTKAFLDSDATDLFMIDADVGWDYKAVKRFLDYKQGVVAGLVPKKIETDQAFHDNALTGEIEDGLLSSLEAPTAFMRIKRSALEKYVKHYPEFGDYYTLDTGAAIWQTGFSRNPAGKMDFKGEDIFFCRQWIAMGEKIWIDPQVEFSHRGSRAWKGNYIDYAMAKGIIKATKEESWPVEQLSPTGT
jgi:hypothetical protein